MREGNLMKKHGTRYKKGFTLVELIAVVAILSIVFGIIYTIFASGSGTYSMVMSDTDAQEEGRKTIEDINQAIINASDVDVSSQGNTVSISGLSKSAIEVANIKPYDGSDTFLYVLDNGKLYRSFSSGKNELVSRGISAARIDKSGSSCNVHVEVSAKKVFKFDTLVTIRNRGI